MGQSGLPNSPFSANRYHSRWRYHHLTDDDPCPILESRYQGPQDFDTVFIRPIMKNPAQEVHIRSFDGLFVEEVMHHELDLVF